jgi:hypothetical protein
MPNLYCVYKSPSDFPGEYVARRFVPGPAGMLPREVAARAPTLDLLRQALPSGMTLLPRQPGDDPVIVESWLSMSDDTAAGDQDALRAALLNLTAAT